MAYKGVRVSGCQGVRDKKDDVYVVIMIGGKGKRLRPLSTNVKPKAFLSVTKDRKTMFQRTVARSLRVTSLGHVIVVANRAHLAHVQRDMRGLVRRNLLLEPIARNTAPAIALASRFLHKHVGDPTIVVLPADQYILDPGKYALAIKKGISFIRDHAGAIVILGHKPGYPSSEFGYIRVGVSGRQGVRDRKVAKVERFVEKPDIETAKRYVKSGKYLWNTGAFIFRVSTILRAFEMHAPDVYNGLPAHDADLARLYKKLPDISIDYAVIEKYRDVYCVAGDYRWQDMGNFAALRSILKREGRKFVERDGKILKIL